MKKLMFGKMKQLACDTIDASIIARRSTQECETLESFFFFFFSSLSDHFRVSYTVGTR